MSAAARGARGAGLKAPPRRCARRRYNRGMTYLRIFAVVTTIAFAALLVWLYGVKTTVIWALAMAGFIIVLWVVTMPLRARQRRVWREMGLGPDGRPLPEEETDEDEADDAGTR
jgi:Flp pilus assembly protein TadB